jgi:hypothetical protein
MLPRPADSHLQARPRDQSCHRSWLTGPVGDLDDLPEGPMTCGHREAIRHRTLTSKGAIVGRAFFIIFPTGVALRRGDCVTESLRA